MCLFIDMTRRMMTIKEVTMWVIEIFEINDGALTKVTGVRLLEWSDVAPAIKMMESNKWPATGIGFKFVRTVTPPKTPWPKIPKNWPTAKPRRSFRPARSTATKTAIDAKTNTNVSKRFPNSIHACSCPSAWWGTGVYEPGVHSGQVGHPNPEPVKRTAPPVTTKAACRKRRSPEAGTRARWARRTVRDMA